MMKNFTTMVLAAMMVLTMGIAAFADDTTTGEHPQGGKPGGQGGHSCQMSEDKMAELEAAAEEAGLTLEEYLQANRPERSADGERPERSTDGERPERSTDGERPERSTDGERPEKGEKPEQGGQRPGKENPLPLNRTQVNYSS